MPGFFSAFHARLTRSSSHLRVALSRPHPNAQAPPEPQKRTLRLQRSAVLISDLTPMGLVFFNTYLPIHSHNHPVHPRHDAHTPQDRDEFTLGNPLRVHCPTPNSAVPEEHKPTQDEITRFSSYPTTLRQQIGVGTFSGPSAPICTRLIARSPPATRDAGGQEGSAHEGNPHRYQVRQPHHCF